MKIIEYPLRENWERILKRSDANLPSVEETVSRVLQEIKQRGDKAVAEYTERFDGIVIHDPKVNIKDIDASENKIGKKLKDAIDLASNNIKIFHESQIKNTKPVETMPGVRCWQKSVPIERVGLYIPGGTAPLFSSVLMLAIPARIAGCKELILCTPPGKTGEIHPAILYCAKITGVNKVFKIGGVQAIGAMAYGTETIQKVYKIFGPGNRYVTMAKHLVSREGVSIDLPAGPSEVAVMADDSAIPEFVASDLLAQAEHGTDSHVVLISNSRELIKNSVIALEQQLVNLPKKEYVRASLNHSVAILVENMQQMIDMINFYAPEHLIISTENYQDVADKIVNAGSVFLGNYTPESAGDYASGTNHTLPTNGYAKSFSGVNMDSYVKKITFQEINEGGLKDLASTLEIMAEAEELTAHKRAVSLRTKYLNNL